MDLPGGSIIFSAIYVGVFLLLAYFFLPRPILSSIAKETGTLVKLSLILNLLCAILLLHAFVSWSARASSLVFLFIIAWGGFFVFGTILLPAVQDGKKMFFPEEGSDFDPAAAQGRKVKED